MIKQVIIKYWLSMCRLLLLIIMDPVNIDPAYIHTNELNLQQVGFIPDLKPQNLLPYVGLTVYLHFSDFKTFFKTIFSTPDSEELLH